MPDHVHLILTPRDKTLPQVMNLIKGGFSHKPRLQTPRLAARLHRPPHPKPRRLHHPPNLPPPEPRRIASGRVGGALFVQLRAPSNPHRPLPGLTAERAAFGRAVSPAARLFLARLKACPSKVDESSPNRPKSCQALPRPKIQLTQTPPTLTAQNKSAH